MAAVYGKGFYMGNYLKITYSWPDGAQEEGVTDHTLRLSHFTVMQIIKIPSQKTAKSSNSATNSMQDRHNGYCTERLGTNAGTEAIV